MSYLTTSVKSILKDLASKTIHTHTHKEDIHVYKEKLNLSLFANDISACIEIHKF